VADLLENTDGLLSVTAIADLSSVAQTTLYTVPVGKTLILTKAILVADEGDVGAALVATIGQNGAADDFVGTTNGDNLDAAEECILMAPVPSATPATLIRYAAGTVIELDVTTGGNGVTGEVYLYGTLRPA
jgi:hypothetical protein